VPGELWITTMQGPLRIKLREDDFLPRRLSDTTYKVRYRPGVRIDLDGKASEPAWEQAGVERQFRFPWRQVAAPTTEFRALCDDTHLYFHFRVHDEDIVVLETLRDEEDEVFEDRVEFYFSRDNQMKEYFCLELDSRGRVMDYRGTYYRQFDRKWSMPGIEARALQLQAGYELEGRIALAGFEALGYPRLQPGVKIRCGLFRAEFSHDRSGRAVVQKPSIHNRGRRIEGPPPIQNWISWIDPRTEEPDFHVPTSLGWLEVVK
jgi:hypothetical protein